MSDETDVEIKQRLGVDGHLWAVEFCKHYPNVDEGHAIGWFCNAMMATYDHRQIELDTVKAVYQQEIDDLAAALADSVKATMDMQLWWAKKWKESRSWDWKNRYQDGLEFMVEMDAKVDAILK